MGNENMTELQLTEAELEQIRGGVQTTGLPKITPKISKESHGKF